MEKRMSEKEYRYMIVGYGRTPIKRVKFVSETVHFATIINEILGKPEHQRMQKKGAIYTTFEEARQAWQDQLQLKVDSLRHQLERANSAVGNAKGLKNPYEDTESSQKATGE
jgi:hypothetical protein